MSQRNLFLIPLPAPAPAPAPEDRYQREQEVVQDWVSGIVGEKFVEEDDETMSQKGQTLRRERCQ
jgi:hypothetical protein